MGKKGEELGGQQGRAKKENKEKENKKWLKIDHRL